ncbi:Protein HASTY 1 [Acorus gramineus]|uniref:Protein HASTY 1 n=1 Tax=Acorus gramineus TaxID=55184 RepID=A0AAV9BLW6_ACOGR|nr:Protein HASTY 1 [Acorus gramineus]
MANPSEEWALKSQAAALAAEAELVAMILRWLPEDVTVHNEDLEGDRRRSLLRGLTESLPEILPLLYNLLEKHFGAAMSEASSQQLDLAKQHATTITAVLNAVNAYAEWAPVIDLAKYGLIHGKRVNDTSVAEYDSAMRNVFQILMNISRDFLCKSILGAAGIDEIEFELAECVCESMVSLGSLNLQCIAGDSSLISQYLQQALLFWLVLMRDGIFKPKVSVQTIGSGPVEKERKGMSMHVSDDICAAMLDVSFQRMLRKNIPSGTTMTVTELELWSDEFVNKCDFSQYRSRLLDLIRLVASHRPVVAAARVSQRIETIIKSCHDASPQALTLLESMQLGLETVVSAVFDGSADLRDDVMVPLQRLLEGLLQQLLSLGWTEPALAEILGHYLDALGPFLRGFPNGLGGVVDKLFQLLTSLPLTIQDQSPTGARHARFQICTSFIRIAKAAERSLLPHMKGIAETMARLQGEGRLLRGEHNLLGEAFLVMASSAGDEICFGSLQLLRSIHSLWSQPVSQSLPPHLRAAMNMGLVEMASFLGEGAKMPKGQLSFADGSLIDMNREGYAEPNENDIRNWLKGVRESGYGLTWGKFLVNHKDLVVPALRISIEVFAWTDGDVELIKFVAKDLFSAIIQALALESNVMIGSDLVGLCREIFVYLSDRDPAPREVLMSLPFIKREDLLAFEEAISKTSSPKEQKLHMKSLLLLSTGNNLKALAAQKSTNVITNVTVKTRSSTTNPGPSAGEDGEVVGLAAFT